MDLVRLGLERSKTAKDALNVIINLLEKYGQGGICSLKNKDIYDNAFLIMDINECFILETKNKHWVYKKVKHGFISNTFSITKPDNFSDIKNFRKTFGRKGKHSGDYRLKLMKRPVKKMTSVHSAIEILQLHNKKDCNTDNKSKSICMHGKYATTASMVVELKKGSTPKIYFTATSHPCQSLFLPYNFGDSIIKPINKLNEQNLSFWQTAKNIRMFDDLKFKEELKEIQNKIISDNLSLKNSLNLRKQIFK